MLSNVSQKRTFLTFLTFLIKHGKHGKPDIPDFLDKMVKRHRENMRFAARGGGREEGITVRLDPPSLLYMGHFEQS